MLIQNKSMFCFGIDAVLLANYAVVNEGDVCMDLCTGNGIIPVLMEAKTKESIIRDWRYRRRVQSLQGKALNLIIPLTESIL